MLLRRLCASIKTVTRAFNNICSALRNRDAVVVIRSLIATSHHCVIVKPGFQGYPKIDLIEYRQLAAASEVPLVRVGYWAVQDLFENQMKRLDDLMLFGAAVVQGSGGGTKISPIEIVENLVVAGWHILTVEEACKILNAQDLSRVHDICLDSSGCWLTPIENIADRYGIATSLFPICEQVVERRTATMIVYTPGLPRAFRLWRLSLSKIMPPLPNVD